MAMRDFKWRARRLWNIGTFEIRGLIIQKKGATPLQLSHNHYRAEWRARLNGSEATARLNVNKANRLLEKLTELQVSTWLGPVNDDAEFALIKPDLAYSVILEEMDEEGKSIGLKTIALKLSKINEQFYYGKLSNDPSYFILNRNDVEGLKVKLME